MKNDRWDYTGLQGSQSDRVLLRRFYEKMDQEIRQMLHIGVNFQDVTVFELLMDINKRLLYLKSTPDLGNK